MIGGGRVSWAEALDRVAAGFLETIETYGPRSVAFYLSGQLLTEDYYVANKLMKGFIGGANVDTNSRLCMASAVAAQKRAFGEDVVPCSYADLDACELMIFAGSNAAWTHPILYQRIAARKSTSNLKVVVIDPRRTATCDIADLHLAIQPGMDAALFNGLLVDLADRGTLNGRFIGAHTEGLETALASARPDAADLPALTGLSADHIETFFRWFSETEKVVTFYSQGINQAANGTDKANSIINVHLATGRIGRPGSGPFSVTGQPNAMGGREVGGMANQLAAHRDFDAESVQKIGRFWKSSRVACKPGLKAVDLFRAVADGEIRALWIMGTNPAVSLPGAAEAGRALARCPLVVVSDCMADTETTRHAHVLLPAAAWGEKDGTVTNSERCISRQRRFLDPLGEAKPDWWIVNQVARRMGFEQAFRFGSAAEIFREHASLSAFDSPAEQLFRLDALATLSDEAYDELAPVRWADAPFRTGTFPTPSGRARFVPIPPFKPVQQGDGETLVVNTGRLRDQWHTMTRTGVAPRLFGHTDTPVVSMHPENAAERGFAAGQLVELRNARGRVRALLEISTAVRSGTLFFPIHWNGDFASPCRVNDLVEPITDPVSGQPESKHAVAGVRAVPVGLWLRYVAPTPMGRIDSEFATRLPAATGWRHEVALADPSTDLRSLIGQVYRSTADANLLRLVWPQGFRWLLEKDGQVLMAGAATARRDSLPAWESLERELSRGAAISWQCLRDGSTTSLARIVCTCYEVREDSIREAISQGCTDTEALGRMLACGTNCGSCLPELNAMLQTVEAATGRTGTG